MVAPLALIGLAFAGADIGIMLGTGKDIVHHVTGVDVWGYILSPILGPPGADTPGSAEAVTPTLWDAVSSWLLPLAVVVGGIALYHWYTTRKKPKRRSA